MVRVVLVDDEMLARQGMRQLLAEHPEVQIVGEAETASIAAKIITSEKPDALFLDICMPGMDGFELLYNLDSPPKVVFVTAHSDHAVHAFEVQAVDYLLKPVRPERLRETVMRLSQVIHPSTDSPQIHYHLSDRICLRTPQRTLVAPLAKILALEAEGDFTRVIMEGESPLLICQGLSGFAATLPSPPFLRLSRSLLINLECIARVENQSRDHATLYLRGMEQAFPLARTARKRLLQALA